MPPCGITVLAALIVAGVAGCQREQDVAVRVSVPNAESIETPAAGVGVVALPYDRDSILASLEQRATTPRPPTEELDTLFARFRGPFTRYTRVSYLASGLRDSLDQLRQGLDSLPPGSAERRRVSAQIQRLSDSLAAVSRQAELSRRELDRARSDFVSRSETLRAAMRQWEDSTYHGYDSIVQRLTGRPGREGSTDTTDQTGWAHFRLGPGRWWLYARAWDTSDPNAEWYWNLPAGDDTVLLSSRTGQRRPRY